MQINLQNNEKKVIAARQISDSEFEPEESREMSASELDPVKISPNISSRMSLDVAESRNGRLDYNGLDTIDRTREDWPMFKPLLVELEPNAELIAYPMSEHRLNFEIVNNNIKRTVVDCRIEYDPPAVDMPDPPLR